MNNLLSVCVELESRTTFIYDPKDHKKTYTNISLFNDIFVYYIIGDKQFPIIYNHLTELVFALHENKNITSNYDIELYENLKYLIKYSKKLKNNSIKFQIIFKYLYYLGFYQSHLSIFDIYNNHIDYLYNKNTKIKTLVKTDNKYNIGISLKTLQLVYKYRHMNFSGMSPNKNIIYRMKRDFLLKNHILNDIYFRKMLEEYKIESMSMIDELLTTNDIFFTCKL